MTNQSNIPDHLLPLKNPDSNQQAEAQPAKTLELLQQAAHDQIELVMQNLPDINQLSQDVQSSHEELQRLDTIIKSINEKITSRFQQEFPNVDPAHIGWVTAYFSSFQGVQDIQDNTKNAFPDLEKSKVDTVIQELYQDPEVANLAQTVNEQNKHEQVILTQANSTLDQAFQSQLQVEQSRDQFQFETGVLLDKNMKANLHLQYKNTEGDIKTTFLDILGVKNTSQGVQFEIRYQNPQDNKTKTIHINKGALSNILYNGNALNRNLSSPQSYNYISGYETLDLDIFKGDLDYIDEGGRGTITVQTQSANSITLSKNITVNGTSKNTLSTQEFSKWATLHKAMPKLSNSELQQAVQKLPRYIARQTSATATPVQSNFELQNGSQFKSLMNQSTIQVQTISPNTVTFTYNNQTITEPNSLFLKTLMTGWFEPDPESANTPSQDSDENQSEGPNEAIAIPTPDESNDKDKEESQDSAENNEAHNEDKLGLAYGGTPAFLKPKTYIDLIGKVLTLDGHIAWVSYSDSETLIKNIVDTIRSNLKISNERALGKAFKNLPLISETMARLESGAKGEISKDHKEYLERIGDWPQWQTIASQEQDPIKFFATCSLLKDKGYLPVHQPAFIANVNRLIASNGNFMSPVSKPNPSNGAEISEQLITFFDKFSEETGTGIEIVEGNSSNMKSAISRFKSQSIETFNNQHEFGMCKLHKLVQKYNETDETVDPHEIKGMLLAAISTGNVPTHELIHYLGMVAGMEKNGRPLISDFGFLDEVKKTFIPATLFMNPAQLNEIKAFYKGALSGYKFKKLEKMDAKLTERLPQDIISKLDAFSYLSNTMRRALDKSDDAIEEGNLDDDHGAYALYTVNHNKFHNSYLFQSNTTRMYRALTAKNGKNALVAFDDYMKGFANTLANKPDSLKSNKGLYKDEYEFIVNSMKNFISLEAGLNKRYDTNSRLSAPSVGEFKDSEKEKIANSKQLISKVLINAGADSTSIDQLMNQDLQPNDLYNLITKLFSQVKPADIKSAFSPNS